MSDWKKILRENFTQFDQLAEFLELSSEMKAKLLPRTPFVLNVPKRLADKMKKNDLEDPLLRQFIPLIEENDENEGFLIDPVQDQTFKLGQKLLQKYPERSLILSTSACAMHCRYCFRQNFPYETEKKGFVDELKVIQSRTDLREIILSGGDPLSLSNESLKNLMDELNQCAHLKRLRFHTRFPIGIPERLDDEFLKILSDCKLQVYFVIHSNHPNEWDDQLKAALKKIQKLGIPVLNQAVLLKGVNDTYETLKDLAEILADTGILFYYLHQLDRVKGTAHFEVSQEKGLALIEELRNHLSGYAVPKYVAEIPNRLSKTPVKLF